MKVYITSLTNHRIDVLFADYIEKALIDVSDIEEIRLFSISDKSYDMIDKSGILIVTNGVLRHESAHTDYVLKLMRSMKTIYTIDDHMCWVPHLSKYKDVKILSQFKVHPTLGNSVPMDYFQVSELAVFNERFSNLEPDHSERKRGNNIVYFGRYKPERHQKYIEVFSNYGAGITVIGDRYPEEIENLRNNEGKKFIEFKPLMKDLDGLYSVLRGYTYTPIFGDSYHNGVNIPYRIYEALMCGVYPLVDYELIGEQELDIHRVMEYLSGHCDKDEYFKWLDKTRDKVTRKLVYFINSLTENSDKIELPGLTISVDTGDISTSESAGDISTSESTVDKILTERGSIYGSYYGGVECRSKMMEALNEKHVETKGCDLPESVRVVFSDILLKLMRAASDPMHEDSWIDLAGYSKIIQEMFEENPYVFKS